jgi:hypothetical protein
LSQFVTHRRAGSWHHPNCHSDFERAPAMRKRFERETFAPTRPGDGRATDEQDELALLAEFMRHDSVASLASGIAARLGGNVRKKDLLAHADLDPRRGRG